MRAAHARRDRRAEPGPSRTRAGGADRHQHRRGTGRPRARLRQRGRGRRRGQHRLAAPGGRPRSTGWSSGRPPGGPPGRCSSTSSSRPCGSRARPSRCRSGRWPGPAAGRAWMWPSGPRPRSSAAATSWRRCNCATGRRSASTPCSSSPCSASPEWARAGWCESSPAFVDAQSELVAWRGGRCLSFGEAVALLGPRRDRQGPGGHPGVGRPAGGSRQAGRRGRRRRWRRLGARVAEGAAGPAGRARDRRGGVRGRGESFMAWRRFLQPGGDPAAPGPGDRGPALGPTRPCSSSSRSWPTSPARSTCWWWGRPGPSCSNGGPAGVPDGRTRRRSRCRPSATSRPRS